ncbi:MAG: FecR family protein [Treponema sp.]|jgi:hypothetical protein|nr:FecR family protein [Treponema sp.]
MKKTALCFVCAVFFINGQNVFSQERTGQAQFLSISGTVEVQEPGSVTWKPAEAGMVVGKDTVISTGFRSSAHVSLENSSLIIRPLTRLTLEEIVQQEDTEEVKLYLQTGRVRAEVKPAAKGRIGLTMRAPIATASVRGTVFEFDTVNLTVESGQVQYSGVNGQTVYVDQGEWTYVDESENRIVSPFETATTLLTPVIPELQNTGGDSTSPPVNVSPPAFSPPETEPDSIGGDVDVGVEWP